MLLVLVVVMTGCIPDSGIGSTAHSEITLAERGNMTGQTITVYTNYTNTSYTTISSTWKENKLISDFSSKDEILAIEYEFYYPLIPGGIYPSKVTLRLTPDGNLSRRQESNCLGCLVVTNHTSTFLIKGNMSNWIEVGK